MSKMCKTGPCYMRPRKRVRMDTRMMNMRNLRQICSQGYLSMDSICWRKMMILTMGRMILIKNRLRRLRRKKKRMLKRNNIILIKLKTKRRKKKG